MTEKDYWDIGIGVSNILLTIAAVGVAIAVPAWQRTLELRRQKHDRKTKHIAIMAWLRDELNELEADITKKNAKKPHEPTRVTQREDIESFEIELQQKLTTLKDSPGILETCPEELLKLVWLLGEMTIDAHAIKAHLAADTPIEEYKYYFSKLHYEPILKELQRLYDYSEHMGLELRKRSPKPS